MVSYTILQVNNNYSWCQLTFQASLPFIKDVYFVRFHPCPAGFVKLDRRCQCDPTLRSDTIFIHTCDINDQTISRPANS